MLWAPYTQRNINAFEAVQRRAAKFVNNYSTYATDLVIIVISCTILVVY